MIDDDLARRMQACQRLAGVAEIDLIEFYDDQRQHMSEGVVIVDEDMIVPVLKLPLQLQKYSHSPRSRLGSILEETARSTTSPTDVARARSCVCSAATQGKARRRGQGETEYEH